MNSALQNGKMLDRVIVTLTRRDVVLMDLCLGLVARDHARDRNILLDIESLKQRLNRFQLFPGDSRKTQDDCGDNCSCQKKTTEKLTARENTAEDLVCGMHVDIENTPVTSIRRGQTYYFCDPICKKLFDTNPDTYIRLSQVM